MSGPPETERREDSYEYHGETVADPYLWLEDDDEAVAEWVAAQNEHADEFLSSLPAREMLGPRVEELARVREYEAVVPRPSGYFQRIREPDQDHSVLYHRESLADEPRELVDPNEFSEDGTVSMNWYHPSPAGDLVAYGVDEGGEENYDVHVLDVETGREVDVVADAGRTGPMMVAWAGDGFYYVRTGSVGGEGQLHKEVRYHELGGAVDAEPVVHEEDDPGTWPLLEADPDGEYVVLSRMVGWERTDLYRLRVGSESPDPLVVGEDAIFEPTLRGEDLYLRTSFGAHNYRLARLDVADPPAVAGPADLETVVAEDDDAILEAFAVTPGHLLVERDRDVVSEVTVHGRDGDHRGHVDLPGPGTVTELAASRTDEECFFRYQSFDHPPSILRYDAAGDGLETVARPDVEVHADLDVSQEWFESADGTGVPAFVVRRTDVERDGSNPAVLYGYGGFEQSLTPEFMTYAVPFLEAGGVLAVANLRGGGEFGEQWHHAARREHKQRTFDDFLAAAEHLVERGYAAPDRLACMGGSNGGLTVGAAITQRPDLFAACLCRVPLADMLRYHRSLLGRSWTTEYGNPEADPEAFEYVRAYSPYHNVEAREYPATLLVTAESDTRVDPFHARKLAARLQEHQQGEAPILLRTYDSTGHGVGKPVSMVVEETLDQWGFLFDRLGVEAADAPWFDGAE